jgi:hypothetical protein
VEEETDVQSGLIRTKKIMLSVAISRISSQKKVKVHHSTVQYSIVQCSTAQYSG